MLNGAMFYVRTIYLYGRTSLLCYLLHSLLHIFIYFFFFNIVFYIDYFDYINTYGNSVEKFMNKYSENSGHI